MSKKISLQGISIDDAGIKVLFDYYNNKKQDLEKQIDEIDDILSKLDYANEKPSKKKRQPRKKEVSKESLRFTIGEKVLLKFKKTDEVEEAKVDDINDKYIVVRGGSFRKDSGIAYSGRSPFLSIQKCIPESVTETVN